MACLLRGVTAVALAVLAAAVFVPTVQAACSSPVLRGVNMVVSCPAVTSEQLFVVPAGVSALGVIAVGGGGGTGSGQGGGAGAVASGQLRVTPGSALYVLVGGAGGPGHFSSGLAGPGGFNGGGSGGSGAGQGGGSAGVSIPSGGGGGGASDLRTCSIRSRSCDTLASRLIVAAGGGGSGGQSIINDFSLSGDGGAGGTQGNDGMASFGPAPGAGGTGATATAPGRSGSTSATPGTRGTGGRGADAGPGRFGSQFGTGGAGGGGGGGLFGGGGGGASGDDLTAGAGGGGGSSFGPPGTTFGRGLRPAGSVTIAYAATPPAVGVRRPHANQVLHRFTGRGKTRKRRQLVISGRAFDPDGVQGVALTLERLPRKPPGAARCTWLHPTRGLRRNSCNRPPPLIATLRATDSWTYRLSTRIKLPAGRYRVSAYGKDTPGMFGNSAPQRARIITFRLSQR
jgi:hypothetical protein